MRWIVRWALVVPLGLLLACSLGPAGAVDVVDVFSGVQPLEDHATYIPLVRGRPESPAIAQCPVYPADHIWNVRVDDLPLDPNSDAYGNCSI